MRKKGGKLRTLVAIRIPDRLKKELGKIQRHLEQEWRDKGKTSPGLLRFVKPDQIHITLAFLGQISAETQKILTEVCRGAVKRIRPFSVNLTQLGAFPRINRPAVVWVGLAGGTKKLELLTKTLELELGSRGIWPIRGSGGFAPHITIARVRRKRRRGQMFLLRELLENTRLDLADIEIPVKEITIYQSNLSPKGPKYLPLEMIKLNQIKSS